MSKRDRDDDVQMEDETAGAGDSLAAEFIDNFLAAVKAGDVDNVRLALNQDAELVDLEDHETLWSPLHHAVKGGHLSVARELLKKNANVAAVTQHDSTLLHLAACNGGALATPELRTNIERIVTLLVDRGCPIHALDNKQNTALHRAAQHGSFGILRALILVAGDNGSKNADGQTVMDRAVAGGHQQCIEFLKQVAASQAGSSSG